MIAQNLFGKNQEDHVDTIENEEDYKEYDIQINLEQTQLGNHKSPSANGSRKKRKFPNR